MRLTVDESRVESTYRRQLGGRCPEPTTVHPSLFTLRMGGHSLTIGSTAIHPTWPATHLPVKAVDSAPSNLLSQIVLYKT
eukprot:365005-Chlamydomonas_euryale.AAC.7